MIGSWTLPAHTPNLITTPPNEPRIGSCYIDLYIKYVLCRIDLPIIICKYSVACTIELAALDKNALVVVC